MVPSRTRALVAAVLVLVTLVGCSEDKKPAPSSASSSAAPASSASSSSSAPTSSPASSESSGPCAAEPPAASAVNLTQAEGDFNGDGETDTLIVYGTGTASTPSPYHVQIELAGGLGRVDDVIADGATDSSGNVKALGGADITASAGLPPDGSGEEAFVEVGSGASAALVGVFQLIECTITRLTGPQGTALSLFPIGGSVTHLDGLRCDGTAGGQKLVQLSASSDDGITYSTSETRLQVEAGHFSPANPPIVGTLAASDPQLQPFSDLDCTGVQAP